MARLSLSKSALSRESRQLKTYERFLPSLDMKRRQLMAERAKVIKAVLDLEQAMAALHERVRTQLPMLANREVLLERLVTLKQARLGRENVMGTRLPVFEGIEVAVRPYGDLAKPHWVDRVVAELTNMLELAVRLRIERRRGELLEEAVRKVTQRVNLFEKVLIPRSRENIKRIRIYLSDAERAAVVRSKIAKAKRTREGLA